MRSWVILQQKIVVCFIFSWLPTDERYSIRGLFTAAEYGLYVFPSFQ